jgi:hypothetical protein
MTLIRPCLLLLLTVAPLAAQALPDDDDPFDERARAEARAAEVEQIQAEFDELFGRAKELYSEIGELGAATEEATRKREQITSTLIRAGAKLFRLSEGYPEAEEWAEDMQTQIDSMRFWVKRFTPIDLTAPEEEGPDEGSDGPVTEEPAPLPTFTVEDLPEGVRPRCFDTAAEARAAAEAAADRGEHGRAFYDLLEVVQYHRIDEATSVTTRQLLEQLRQELVAEELLVYLRDQLGSKDPAVRLFAAREIGVLGEPRSVEPLVRRLREEKHPRVREAILGAFRLTPRRETGRQLARLARERDQTLRLAIIEILSGPVGGRHGALALVDFAADDDPVIWQAALDGIERIGGDAAVGALGAITRNRRNPPKLVHESFHALCRIGTTAAAGELCSFLVKKGRYLYASSDDVVAIGGEAVPALIAALRRGKLRAEANDCLRRISGENMGASVDKWKDWYRQWIRSGRPRLPCYARGMEPWN